MRAYPLPGGRWTLDYSESVQYEEDGPMCERCGLDYAGRNGLCRECNDADADRGTMKP